MSNGSFPPATGETRALEEFLERSMSLQGESIGVDKTDARAQPREDHALDPRISRRRT